MNRLRREEYVTCGPVFPPLTAAFLLAIVREEHWPVKEEIFMELHRTEQGFALYKEKDCIGECTLSPAPKGAQLAALCILPRWRRKGYGSYLCAAAPRI